MLGNENFQAGIDFSSIANITYEYAYSSRETMKSQGKVPEGFIYKGYFEETYSGQKYLIFRYEDTSRNKDIYDKAITKFSDDSIFMTQINYAKSERYNGYSLLSKFIESGKTKEIKNTNTTKTSEDYMVVGTDQVGYVKLPGTWKSTKVDGAADSSVQYAELDTYTGSTATGSWLVTLNVLEKTYTTSAKRAAELEENYYKVLDDNATNVKVEQAKMGKYNAYKLFAQYKNDNVWVVTWYFEAEDGLVHVIQVEGLDLTKDKYFDIPETFSLTKIN